MPYIYSTYDGYNFRNAFETVSYTLVVSQIALLIGGWRMNEMTADLWKASLIDWVIAVF